MTVAIRGELPHQTWGRKMNLRGLIVMMYRPAAVMELGIEHVRCPTPGSCWTAIPRWCAALIESLDQHMVSGCDSAFELDRHEPGVVALLARLRDDTDAAREDARRHPELVLRERPRPRFDPESVAADWTLRLGHAATRANACSLALAVAMETGAWANAWANASVDAMSELMRACAGRRCARATAQWFDDLHGLEGSRRAWWNAASRGVVADERALADAYRVRVTYPTLVDIVCDEEEE